jgi:hypothetical protein
MCPGTWISISNSNRSKLQSLTHVIQTNKKRQTFKLKKPIIKAGMNRSAKAGEGSGNVWVTKNTLIPALGARRQ